MSPVPLVEQSPKACATSSIIKLVLLPFCPTGKRLAIFPRCEARPSQAIAGSDLRFANGLDSEAEAQ
jgi:hypothetical protein